MGLLDDLRSGEATDDEGPRAQSWRWENAGDGIEGTVVKTSSRVHDNHPEGYPIVTIRDEKGEDWAIHGMTYVLKTELTERNLRPGDLLAVIYDGKKTSSNSGRPFHAFRVASKQGEGKVPDAAAQPAQQAPQQRSQAPAPASTGWGNDAPPF